MPILFCLTALILTIVYRFYRSRPKLESKVEEASSFPPIAVVKPLAQEVAEEQVTPASVEMETPSSEAEAVAPGESGEQVIAVPIETFRNINAQIAGLQAQLSQLQQNTVQQKPQTPLTKGSIALPVIPQSRLNDIRKQVDESTEREDETQNIEKASSNDHYVPAPPPLPATPLYSPAEAIIPRKASNTDIPKETQENDAPNDSKTTSINAELQMQLAERVKTSGLGLKKTPNKEDKKGKQENIENNTLKFTLRPTKQIGESEQKLPKKNEPNLILSELEKRLRKRKDKEAEAEPSSENSNQLQKDDSVVVKEVKNESLSNAQLKTPSLPSKPKSQNEDTHSIQFIEKRKVTRTTSLCNNRTSPAIEAPMMEHITKMLKRRKSQIYFKSDTPAQSITENITVSSETREKNVENSKPKEEKAITCIKLVEDVTVKAIPANEKSDNVLEQKNIELSKAESTPPPPLIEENNENASTHLETTDPILDNPEISPAGPPPPAPPPPPILTNPEKTLPTTKTEIRMKYTKRVEETSNGESFSRTTTQSVSGKASSSDPGSNGRGDLFAAIKGFEKGKLRKVTADDQKKQKGNEIFASQQKTIEAALKARLKAFLGSDDDNSSEEEGDDWEE